VIIAVVLWEAAVSSFRVKNWTTVLPWRRFHFPRGKWRQRVFTNVRTQTRN